jgi:hypothetical protein
MIPSTPVVTPVPTVSLGRRRASAPHSTPGRESTGWPVTVSRCLVISGDQYLAMDGESRGASLCLLGTVWTTELAMLPKSLPKAVVYDKVKPMSNRHGQGVLSDSSGT